jgi:hypothetical protein
MQAGSSRCQTNQELALLAISGLVATIAALFAVVVDIIAGKRFTASTKR